MLKCDRSAPKTGREGPRVTTIYKSANAQHGGGGARQSLSWLGRRWERWLSSISRPPRSRRDGGKAFRAVDGFDAGCGRRRHAWGSAQMEPSRGGDLFPHLYAALPVKACFGRSLCRMRSTDGACSGAKTVIGLFDRLARPFLYALDPEDAHVCDQALKFAPLPSAAATTRGWRCGFRAQLLQSGRIAAGFDKNAEVPDALLR